MLKFETQAIDQLAAVRRLEKLGDVEGAKSAYNAFRRYAGVYGKAGQWLDRLEAGLPRRKLGDVLRGRPGQIDLVAEHAKLRRLEEIKPQVLPEEFASMAEVTARRKAIEALPEAKEIIQAAQALPDYANALMKESLDAGLISKASYDEMLKQGEHYIPLQRMIAGVEDAIGGAVRSSGNVGKGKQKGLYRAFARTDEGQIRGSELAIRDPIESLVQKTYQTVTLAERNKAISHLGDLAARPEWKNVVRVLKGDQQPLRGMGKVTYLKDGNPAHLEVPDVVAEAVTGLGNVQADLVTQAVNKSVRVLRATATTYNPFFFTRNIWRDQYTALFRAETGYNPPFDFLRGLSSYLKADKHWDDYLSSGAGLTGWYQRTNLEKTARQLTEPAAARALRDWNPLSLIRKIGEASESATRVGVFRRAIRKGKSLEEAALISRDASVDFAKYGTAGRIINQWVPFINARWQGSVNFINALRENPKRSAVLAGYTVWAPTIATYYHNTTFFPEVWEDIPQWEKDDSVIVIYGDQKDERGEYTQLVKIPKGEILSALSNPVQNYLEYLSAADPKTSLEVAGNVLNDLSPIDFSYGGKRAAAQVTPIPIRVGLEAATRMNFYTGRDLEPARMRTWPEQKRYSSDPANYYYVPDWLARIGQYTGSSPLLLKNALQGQFAFAGRAATSPPGKTADTLGRYFLRARGGAVDQKQRKRDREVMMEVGGEESDIAHKAEQLFMQVRDAQPSERRQILLGALRSGEASAATMKRLDSMVQRELGILTPREQALMSSRVEVRARRFIEELQGMSAGDRSAKVYEWRRKRLLTKNVQSRMDELMAEQAIPSQSIQ